ncbi:hypothetical protein BASA81_001773 [Batrachochytrium salamandrivorans]|nr:hypothetical protein BASA81_001773 [Batrachochytrium salamandrivorans]
MPNSAPQLGIAVVPADILRRHVFPFLGVRSVARCASVCGEWKLAVDHDSVWKSRCAKLWERKLNVPKVLTPGEPESLYAFSVYLGHELGLSVRELKQILAERMVKGTESFMYKHEFVTALENSQPEEFPGWTLSRLSKWKTAYLGSFLRINVFSGISRPELVNSNWVMDFRFNQQQSKVEFRPDGTFHMPMQQEQFTGLVWKFQHSGREGDLEPFSHYIIQIGSYPPLSVSRDEDWGFVLTNEHVVMRQAARRE